MSNVYILGAGGIGTLVASVLTKRYPVNFLVRRKEKLDLLKKTNNTFTITQLFNQGRRIDCKIARACQADDIPDQHIDFLIVSVKTFDTVKSLMPLLPRISPSTNIMLIQNGMGVLEELYASLWPQASERPVIYQGVITHGVFQDRDQEGTFDYNHAGNGDFKIARVDGKNADHPVLKTLVESDLCTTVYSYEDLLVHQVAKLMVNCCMNPTTAVLDCVNYEIDGLESIREYFSRLVHEAMEILRVRYPSLAGRAELDESRLVEFILEKGCKLNGKNSTSMRQDTLFLRDTEIDYINGYIVNLAEQQGTDAPYNRTIQLLTKSRLRINRSRAL
ncbi:uncharacterized protein OGAPODRAFT_100410 [Ogataea polymorpha]|uniref:uncharacterized protein n=1 Tax=Ogataea polymorpha TaxID=460523 RepID=UPI0007F3CCFB|nr:uncharacterized protein OGAPODRAFT_100410 [Ogataea polymorpha]KAG7933429.1 hypothetical protein KL934_003239 [Ogataea polymorpha]OBA15684.1 hypothetical protein OGAPODRAFT_100410 [Ogataea polymorpha]